jgi:hypothetical protein
MTCVGLGRPLTFFLSPSSMGDAQGALVRMDAVPPTAVLLDDKRNDADRLGKASENKGITDYICDGRGLKSRARHDR